MAMAAAAPRYWVSRDVPASLHAAMRALGWDNEAAAAGELEDADLSRCALVWKTARLSASEWAHVRRAAGRQCRVNHFEGMRITEKAELCRALRRMAAVHGAATFDFHPQTFQLPAEAALFAREAALHEAEGALWIIKPASSSRGRGIHLVRRAEEARVGFGGCVAQRYVARPLLVGGFKFDMRVYVLVASLVPLTVYICQEGLARFGTARYDAGDTGNLFAHLTNFTLNKRSPGLAVDKEVIGAGAKWTLSRLLAHLAADRGVDTTALWRRVELIAALTVLSCVQSARADSRSFQLLGLDILVDEDARPWLLEVNRSPSIGVSSEEDRVVKLPMLRGLLALLGLAPPHPAAADAKLEEKQPAEPAPAALRKGEGCWKLLYADARGAPSGKRGAEPATQACAQAVRRAIAQLTARTEDPSKR